MLGNFNLPPVDHLREGIDYRIIEWDFADGAPATPPVPHTPGQPCPPGHKMVFGLCRRLKSGAQDWNPQEDSDSERAGKLKAQAEGSSFENNKPVQIGDRKYGWAKKGGSPVLVEWGSVAGIKTKLKSSTSPTNPAKPSDYPPAPVLPPPISI